MSQVSDQGGNIYCEPSHIERAFLNFYTTLWTTPADPISDILNAFPCDLPQLFDIEGAHLIRAVTKDEVYYTLLDLPYGKSLGPNGFNVEFYSSFWHVLEDHFFTAICHFFENCIMPSSWGKTFIVLIPKKDKPRFVSDYRPISLCNVCFKIISKLLANRLKIVLPHLIGREQVGLVANWCSFDNIIVIQ